MATPPISDFKIEYYPKVFTSQKIKVLGIANLIAAAILIIGSLIAHHGFISFLSHHSLLEGCGVLLGMNVIVSCALAAQKNCIQLDMETYIQKEFQRGSAWLKVQDSKLKYSMTVRTSPHYINFDGKGCYGILFAHQENGVIQRTVQVHREYRIYYDTND